MAGNSNSHACGRNVCALLYYTVTPVTTLDTVVSEWRLEICALYSMPSHIDHQERRRRTREARLGYCIRRRWCHSRATGNSGIIVLLRFVPIHLRCLLREYEIASVAGGFFDIDQARAESRGVI
jgi:hypothetical protein